MSTRAWLSSHLAPSKHTTYFEVLDALQEEGCPVCRLASRSVAWYLDMLSYEGVNDPGVRNRLRAARGFCNYHAWRFAGELRNAPGRAMIYRDILGLPLRSLQAGAAAEQLLPSGECPACESLARAARRYLGTLLEHLAGQELRQRYGASAGLCLPHLRQALRRAQRAEDVEALLEVANRWANGLRVASRSGLAGPTSTIVAGLVGGPGAILPAPLPLAAVAPGAGDGFAAGSAEGQQAVAFPGTAAASAAQGPAGCPACREALAAADGALLALARASRAQGPDAEQPAAVGICSVHAWRSLELLPPGAAARLWQPAARAATRRLREESQVELTLPGGRPGLLALFGAAGPGPGAEAAVRLAPPESCPACRAQAAAERRSAQALLRQVGGREIPSSLHLCLPHFALSLRWAGDGQQRLALAGEQVAALQALRAELGEYLRKQNYRCREPRGGEADSPWRAMAQVAGAAGLAAGALGWGWARHGRAASRRGVPAAGSRRQESDIPLAGAEWRQQGQSL